MPLMNGSDSACDFSVKLSPFLYSHRVVIQRVISVYSLVHPWIAIVAALAVEMPMIVCM